MVRSKRHAVLSVLLCLTVLLAGCSAWGSDGPSDNGAEPNGTDDLEEADAEADDGGDEPASSAPNGDADDGDEIADESADDDDADPADDAGTGEDETETDEGDKETDADGTDEADDTVDAGDADADEDEVTDDGAAESGGEDDASDGSTLTVETADVVTGEPVDADVIVLEQDSETIGEASGTSATFDGLEDGEYELAIYDDLGDWAYGDTVTVDGGDATYVAEIDQEHTYWPGVEVTVVDGDGEPVEGETVTIDGQDYETGPDGTVTDEIESSYTDEREFVVEYGEQIETVEVDWESWDGEPETVTFEVQNGEDADGGDGQNAALAVAA